MRLIDADALETEFIRMGTVLHSTDTARTAAYVVNKTPTIDAAPVVHGRWLPDDKIEGLLVCSQCGYLDHRTTNDYCPACGAKMDKEAYRHD